MPTKKKIQEIVINTQYGGFGLSEEAVMAYAAKKKKSITKYVWVPQSDGQSRFIFDEKDPAFQKRSSLGMVSYLWGKHSSYDEHCNTNDFSHRDIKRDDKDLVAVVKKLGKKANGDCASLKVVKVPSDVNWQIEEYDGREWISEVHSTWR